MDIFPSAVFDKILADYEYACMCVYVCVLVLLCV
jgi:hypothetical protein